MTLKKVKPPTYMPQPPIPAIALPTMSAFIVGADAEMALPISKSVTCAMYSHLMLNREYAFDHGITRVAAGRTNAAASHGNLSNSPSELMMFGWMSAT